MEGSVLTAVLYPVFPFSLWKAVTIFPICKPYIFCRPDLLNTEIIITAALIRLYFRSQLSVLMEGGFSSYGNTIDTNQCCCPQNKLSRQQRLQMRQPYQQTIKQHGGDLGVHKTNWYNYHIRGAIYGYSIIQRIRAWNAPCVYRRNAIGWSDNSPIGQQRERSEWSFLRAKYFTLYQTGKEKSTPKNVKKSWTTTALSHDKSDRTFAKKKHSLFHIFISHQSCRQPEPTIFLKGKPFMLLGCPQLKRLPIS